MVGDGELQPVDEQERQRDETRRQDRMQQEHIGIDAQQLGPECRPEIPPPRCLGPRNIPWQGDEQQGRDESQECGEHEQGGHPEMTREFRAENHRKHEGAAHTNAEHRHRPRAHAITRCVRDKRRQGR